MVDVKNETFVCFVYGKHIWDEYSERETPELTCSLMNFTATLWLNNFGYFCMAFIALIIFISIFGGIKESYRWFILNQAIWDLLISYDYSCSNYVKQYVTGNAKPTCFYYSINYSDTLDLYYLDTFILKILQNNSYTALVPLTLSRFIALYFMMLYERLTMKRRVFYIIFIFNFLNILLSGLYVLNYYFLDERESVLNEDCELRNVTYKACYAEQKADFHWRLLSNFYDILLWLESLKPTLLALISIMITLLIILRIAKQALFQLKHNRRDFISSLRISGVIILQTFINAFVFLLGFYATLEDTFSKLGIDFLDSGAPYTLDIKNYPGYLDLRLPMIFGEQGLRAAHSYQMIIQFRILIEALLVLFIMTGYREAIIKFVKFIFSLIRNPKKVQKTITLKMSQSSTRVITLK